VVHVVYTTQNSVISRCIPVAVVILFKSLFSLSRDWSKRVTWLKTPQLKLGNIRVIFPNFQNCTCCEKYLKDNKHKSLHLARKCAKTFVLGHYLLLEGHSFGTDDVRGQMSEHIFAPNGGYCLYILVFVVVAIRRYLKFVRYDNEG